MIEWLAPALIRYSSNPRAKTQGSDIERTVGETLIIARAAETTGEEAQIRKKALNEDSVKDPRLGERRDVAFSGT
jgi:hypothetical protein